MESRRQLQLAKLVQQNLSDVYQRFGADIYGKAFVSISAVKMTPDLLMARVYLSIFNVEDKQFVLESIQFNTPFLRKELGNRLRKKVRRIPEMEFFMDDTLDEVFKLNTIFDKLKDGDEEDVKDDSTEANKEEEE